MHFVPSSASRVYLTDLITQKARRAAYGFFGFKNPSILKKGTINSKVPLHSLTCELDRKQRFCISVLYPGLDHLQSVRVFAQRCSNTERIGSTLGPRTRAHAGSLPPPEAFRAPGVGLGEGSRAGGCLSAVAPTSTFICTLLCRADLHSKVVPLGTSPIWPTHSHLSVKRFLTKCDILLSHTSG